MERYDDGFAEERQRIERLVEEIIAGEHKIDKLPNSSAGFSGAAQAEYFSKARYHLESDVSNLIVNHIEKPTAAPSLFLPLGCWLKIMIEGVHSTRCG